MQAIFLFLYLIIIKIQVLNTILQFMQLLKSKTAYILVLFQNKNAVISLILSNILK